MNVFLSVTVSYEAVARADNLATQHGLTGARSAIIREALDLWLARPALESAVLQRKIAAVQPMDVEVPALVREAVLSVYRRKGPSLRTTSMSASKLEAMALGFVSTGRGWWMHPAVDTLGVVNVRCLECEGSGLTDPGDGPFAACPSCKGLLPGVGSA